MHRVAACDSLRARQTKGGPHAPENPTPTPAVNLTVNIEGLAKGLEGAGGLFVGKNEGKPQQFPVDASGRGEDRRDGRKHDSRYFSVRSCLHLWNQSFRFKWIWIPV